MPYTNPTSTPGVYIQEGPPASRPIEGVATSVAAFIGLAPAGPVNTPTLVTSWSDFARKFGAGDDGPFMKGAYLAHCVNGFFLNGGTIAWIVRVGTDTFHGRPMAALPSAVSDVPAPFEAVLKDGVPTQDDKDKDIAYGVEIAEEDARTPPAGLTVDPKEAAPPAKTYKVTVTGGAEPEVFEGLTATPGPHYLATVVTERSQLVSIVPSGGLFSSVELAPAPKAYKLEIQQPAPNPDSDALVGDSSRMTGMEGLALADDVTIVCLPDLMTLQFSTDDIANVQSKAVKFCSDGRRMAILDPPPALNDQEILAWRNSGKLPGSPDSRFATLYWPWIQVKDPITKTTIDIPPCGHVAGAWAGTDGTRGVHKAPANVNLAGVVGLGFAVSDSAQSELNHLGVNCIRTFPARGTLIWGARTLETDGEWKYLNVRRLFNYLMASILESTQWAVFEPNDEVLWGQLRVSVSNFLTRTWRTGALFGATPDEAFFVKCDEETNPPDLIEAGQVNVKIGVAPVKPAEFVVFEISQFQPGS
ncbi:tail sheath [Baekduia alba]|uniref:phage tail sheath family protein n=1 Tax=Baekduia alba TaxID=2997333 RepID=UPI0023416475|nr:phage tail sheath C-terminal domain-containing protein [Baekduia alba]WCB93487.1 tail sheath [Baekduia alba]